VIVPDPDHFGEVLLFHALRANVIGQGDVCGFLFHARTVAQPFSCGKRNFALATVTQER
jgi:hypothetical protein